MITFFTAPKPFKGLVNIIQRNAIESWLRLYPSCEVILFGDEMGIAEVAQELKVRHIPEVSKNEYGTPLISYLFEKAQDVAKNNLLCFVNSDIILMSDFMEGAQVVNQWRKERPFLLVGPRRGVDIDTPWNFEQADWENHLRALVIERNFLVSQHAIDYFLFTRGLLKQIPPFAIGRPGWDNWMIYKVRSMHAPVIDSGAEIMAVHQNHDYYHLPKGEKEFREGTEAKRNVELAGSGHHLMNLNDATHILTPHGVKHMPFIKYLRRFLHTMRMVINEYSPLS